MSLKKNLFSPLDDAESVQKKKAKWWIDPNTNSGKKRLSGLIRQIPPLSTSKPSNKNSALNSPDCYSNPEMPKSLNNFDKDFNRNTDAMNDGT